MDLKIMLVKKGYSWAKGVFSKSSQAREITEKVVENSKKLFSKNTVTTPCHYSHGEILAQQAAKQSASKPVFTSTPTQEYIDQMIGVERIDALKAEGMFDRRRCANALATFKAQGKPSVVKSVPTQQAVDELNATRIIEELETYEKTGQLSPRMLEKRIDMYEALYGNDGLPVMQEFIAKQRKILEKLKKTYRPIKGDENKVCDAYDAGKSKLAKLSEKYPKLSEAELNKPPARLAKKEDVVYPRFDELNTPEELDAWIKSLPNDFVDKFKFC